MARQHGEPQRSPLPCPLVIAVCSPVGGAGRSAAAGLLTVALTRRFTGRAVLLDTAPAGGSPWPEWLGQTEPGPASHAWAWPQAGPDIAVITTDATSPGERDQRLATLAAGQLPDPARDASIVVIDGPAGQAAAATRTRHHRTWEGFLPRWAATAGYDGQRVALGVLATRGDMTGLAAALRTVTALEAVGVALPTLVVAVTSPAGGLPGNVRARVELLQDRVGAIVTVPFQRDVARAGATAYTDASVLRRAAELPDSILRVAGQLYARPPHQVPAPAPVVAAVQTAAPSPTHDPYAVLLHTDHH